MGVDGWMWKREQQNNNSVANLGSFLWLLFRMGCVTNERTDGNGRMWGETPFRERKREGSDENGMGFWMVV